MDNSNNCHQEEIAIATTKNTEAEEERKKYISIAKPEPTTTTTTSTTTSIPTIITSSTIRATETTPSTAKNSGSSDELPTPSTSRALIPFNPNPIPLLPVPPVTAPPVTPASSKTPTDQEDEKKPDSREHKKRSKNWTRIETLTLIRLRTQLAPRFAKSGRKSELWDEIADTLRKNNFSRDAQQCRDKWEKLMAGYKEVRDGIKSKEDNPYYEELHPLLSNRPVKRDREPAENTGNEFNNIRSESPPARTTTSAGIGVIPVLKATPIASSIPGDAHHHSHHHQQHHHQHHQQQQHLFRNLHQDRLQQSSFRAPHEEEDAHTNEHNDYDDGDDNDGILNPRKKPKLVSSSDLQALQALVESIISRQQKFFKDLLEAIDKKEQLREKIRLEREEKWRAEERAQRLSFAEAMNILTQKLTGDDIGGGFVPPRPTASASATMAPIIIQASPAAAVGAGAIPSMHHQTSAMHHATPVATTIASSMQHPSSASLSTHTEPLQVSSVMTINPLTTVSPVNTTTPPTLGASTAADTPSVAASPSNNQGPKKRSKNWKRTEVLQLIKLRGEMDEKFVKSTRRAPLWDELAEALACLGINRDGKQCREKWDKLMSEYKEVLDGKKDKGDSPYFPELQAALDHARPGEAV